MREGPVVGSYPVIVLVASLAFRALVAKDISSLTAGLLLLGTNLLARTAAASSGSSAQPASPKQESVPPQLRATQEAVELLDELPFGVALKSAETGKWTHCNQALCGLLSAPDQATCAAKMAAIAEKADQQAHNANSHSPTHNAQGNCTFQLRVPASSRVREGAEDIAQARRDSDATSPLARAGDSKDLGVCRKEMLWCGRPAQVYACYDLTEMKRVERRQTGRTIQSKMLRTLSHELRTPIHCILNSLEFCKQALGEDASGVEENLNIAMANCNMLFSKYSDILVSVQPQP